MRSSETGFREDGDLRLGLVWAGGEREPITLR